MNGSSPPGGSVAAVGMVRFPAQIRLAADNLVLRDWIDDDLTTMTALFDEPMIRRWTPLASPFTTEAARDYLAAAHRARDSDRGIQLAITFDGRSAVGEVLLFRTGRPTEAELAYAVGEAHRGQGLAQRSVTALADYARRELGIDSPLLRIDPANTASRAVARKAGYVETDEPIVERARPGGRTVRLRTWRPVGRMV